MMEIRKRHINRKNDNNKLAANKKYVSSILKRSRINKKILLSTYHINSSVKLPENRNSSFSNSVKYQNCIDTVSKDVLFERNKNINNLSDKTVLQCTKRLPFIFEFIVKGLSERWQNWIVRIISAIFLTAFFSLIIYSGPIALMITVLIIQVKGYEEIMNIGYSFYNIYELPRFRFISWYFLVISNYFFYGESLLHYINIPINNCADLTCFLADYHRFISYCLYIIGFIWFVLSLVPKYYEKQFILFAWTHIALLTVVMQSYLIIENIFMGLIWVIVPVTMIFINDIGAYMFGFFFGRTPLIGVSPKKTWEGFIGGGLVTVIFGPLLSYFLCQFQYFICPIEYKETLGRIVIVSCEPSALFQLREYTVPQIFSYILDMLRVKKTFTTYPFVLHSFSMILFSSVVGPFGGFFASGFKRVFNIKDFGDLIPGHGGIMDRFDCQILMATFVNVYISSFICLPSPQKLLQQIFLLQPEQQLHLFYDIQKSLENQGVLKTL